MESWYRLNEKGPFPPPPPFHLSLSSLNDVSLFPAGLIVAADMGMSQ